MVVKCITQREKTIIELSINDTAYNWVLQQFKLCFFLDSVQAQWNLQQKLCPFQENQVTVQTASLKENVQSHWTEMIL